MRWEVIHSAPIEWAGSSMRRAGLNLSIGSGREELRGGASGGGIRRSSIDESALEIDQIGRRHMAAGSNSLTERKEFWSPANFCS